MLNPARPNNLAASFGLQALRATCLKTRTTQQRKEKHTHTASLGASCESQWTGVKQKGKRVQSLPKLNPCNYPVPTPSLSLWWCGDCRRRGCYRCWQLAYADVCWRMLTPCIFQVTHTTTRCVGGLLICVLMLLYTCPHTAALSGTSVGSGGSPIDNTHERERERERYICICIHTDIHTHTDV